MGASQRGPFRFQRGRLTDTHFETIKEGREMITEERKSIREFLEVLLETMEQIEQAEAEPQTAK